VEPVYERVPLDQFRLEFYASLPANQEELPPLLIRACSDEAGDWLLRVIAKMGAVRRALAGIGTAFASTLACDEAKVHLATELEACTIDFSEVFQELSLT